MVPLLVMFFCVSLFIIVYAMIGYPILLKIIDKIKRPSPNEQNYEYEPNVTYMIVAHNEEKVINLKLVNILNFDYPFEKLQIIVASDNCTDETNQIVSNFIKKHKDLDIVLFCSKEHKGKTNAQNEAQKIANGEVIIMTDANTMLKPNAVRELVSYFISDDIAYVCGKLEYSNSCDNMTTQSESKYWNLDLIMRDIESRIYTITAGNGALYACRNSDYIDFNPISCHDSIMPYTYAKSGKKALFNPNSIATEKAGETDVDEFKRKVRMNRDILEMLSWGFKVLNPFKYQWFSLFYFGHRTCRYSLWWAHILLVISSLGLVLYGSFFAAVALSAQILFFAVAGIEMKITANNRLFHMVGYYGMTVFAQIIGVVNIITGRAKSTWDSVATTR